MPSSLDDVVSDLLPFDRHLMEDAGPDTGYLLVSLMADSSYHSCYAGNVANSLRAYCKFVAG
jgi:hypothetical protein